MMDESKRYESAKHIVAITGFVLDVLILLYLLLSGSSIRIRQFAETLSSFEWISIAVYTLIITAIFKLIDLPLSFYSGHLLEHRFGLSRQSFASWIKDQLKALALGTALSLAAVEVMYWLLSPHPDLWWLYASLAFITFVILMSNLAPVLLFPLFFKFRPVENQDLQTRVTRLARRTGANVCGIFEWSLGE